MTALKKNPQMGDLIEIAIDIATKESGNVFTDEHHFLIETKIRKRMMDLDITTVPEYYNYVTIHRDSEHDYFVSELTIHHTFFFREFRHFEYLQLNLPKIIENIRSEGRKTIKVLCLACSRGQETYSLAMFFDFHLKQLGINDFDFDILGTDVDKKSVATAANGVYRFNDIKTIPMKYLGDHWQRGKGDIADFVKIKNTLRSKCHFQAGSIEKLDTDLQGENYDIIFCRNVFIYFNDTQIKNISADILKHLNPEGLFFTGVSESLTMYDLPIAVNGPSVYTHKKTQETVVDGPTIANITPVEKEKASAVEIVMPSLPETLKVLCVDDSKIILSLLKRILNATPGFEVVGTAENGEEATKFLAGNKVDVMTLDIHMPVMDGISYLKKNLNIDHPAVVIVSSVSREDAGEAMNGLKLGASDYIEKPTLDDFMQKGDEICTKLRVAALDKLTSSTAVQEFSTVDKEFHAKTMDNPDEYFYGIYAQLSDRKKFTHIIKELDQERKWPATFLLLEGSYNILDKAIEDIKASMPTVNIKNLSGQKEFLANTVYIGDFKSNYEAIVKQNKKNVFTVLGHSSTNAEILITKWKPTHLLLDDVNFSQSKKTKLQEMASDIGPYTSFAYQAKYFILKDE